jgi:hypothetical protein
MARVEGSREGVSVALDGGEGVHGALTEGALHSLQGVEEVRDEVRLAPAHDLVFDPPSIISA